MTWLGPDAMVRGWTPDGHILFVTTYGQPFFRNYRAYTLDAGRRHSEALAATVRSITSRCIPEEPASSAATPPIRRAGSATTAAPPAISWIDADGSGSSGV